MAVQSAKAKATDISWPMEVFFNASPALDLAALGQFVDRCEPNPAESCELRAVGGGDEPNAQGLRVGAFAACLGSLNVATLLHGVPSLNAAMRERTRRWGRSWSTGLGRWALPAGRRW